MIGELRAEQGALGEPRFSLVVEGWCLVDVSDIFYFFSSGRGKGESEASGGGGGRSLLKFPGGGGFRRGPRGRESVCSELGNWGGGLNIFFSGPKCPPSWCLKAQQAPMQHELQPDTGRTKGQRSIDSAAADMFEKTDTKFPDFWCGGASKESHKTCHENHHRLVT